MPLASGTGWRRFSGSNSWNTSPSRRPFRTPSSCRRPGSARRPPCSARTSARTSPRPASSECSPSGWGGRDLSRPCRGGRRVRTSGNPAPVPGAEIIGRKSSMTEKKGRRRYWRRRPRRKNGEAAGAGPSAPPPAGAVPGEGGASAEVPAGEEATLPGENSGSVPEQPGESLTAPDVPEAAKTVEGTNAAPKGRRRRSRRRGKGGQAATAGQPPGEQVPQAGAPSAEETVRPGEERVQPAGGIPASAETISAEGERVPAAEAPDQGAAITQGAEAAPAGEPEGTPSKGRRRSRRRGRRRGKALPQLPEGGPVAEIGQPAEEFGGAEGTSSEETAVAQEPGAEAEAREEEEEEGEEEAAETVGKGPRKVMLIDGIHPEEIRVAFVSDGNLDYFEVENQRRKQFKGNIYKAKVVNVAHAIEAAFVEFGGGRHGFLPLNEYCGGALIENLGSWDEGEKRPHLRPGTEILVQVTKEES